VRKLALNSGPDNLVPNSDS